MAIYTITHITKYTYERPVIESVNEIRVLPYICKEQELSFENRKAIRQEKSVPILKNLGLWLQQNYVTTLPKSAIGKAIAYSLERWERLSTYTTDGKLNIDNNPVENSIRPVALGYG